MTVPPLLFDPTDPSVARDPFPTYARLRESHPVWRSPASGIWFLTRHADVHAAWRDKRLGSSFTHRYTAEEFVADGELPPWHDARYADFAAFERWDLISLEPPDHTKLRRLVVEAFTPRAIERQRPVAQRLVDQRLAAGRERGTLDLVRDIAEPLSLAIICDLIGVPPSDRSAVLALSHDVVAMYEPQPPDAQKARANAAAREFMDYTAGLIAERRRTPADDLLGGLLDAVIDGERLSDEQVTSTVMLLLMAGHEASVNAAGNGVAAFAAHPEQWDLLRSDAALLKPAIEETLRFDPPLQFFQRWVLEEGFEVEGTPVPRGARVGLMIGSANRDPRRYPEPDAFRIARGEASHLSFGGGIHFCLGAPLARLELEVLFGSLAASLPRIELLPGAVRRPGFQFRGYSSLPIAPTA
ncbi:MAG: cytochrome P450 [Candidatus Eisenbacteria bacterium]|nr:cytochrome P450 [Candidatus Eisenbacteria bacterium]